MTTLSVYLCARFQDAATMREWAAALAVENIVTTSRWITGAHDEGAGPADDETLRRFASEDLEDLRAADALVAWNPRWVHRSGRGGRHVELGYALAIGKPVILVGERENVFHWLDAVAWVPVPDALPQAIRDVVRARAIR